MASYEFKRIYHPKMGRFIYRHKGNGLIVDNIFKPIKSAFTSAFKKVAKPMAKKALESGISHAGDKLGKKAVEKSGEMIMKKLHGLPTKSFSRTAQSFGLPTKSFSRTAQSFGLPTKSFSRFPKEIGSTKPSLTTIKPTKPKQEDYNLILNRLISGNGLGR